MSSKRNLGTVPPQFYMLLFLDISSIAQLCPTLCDPMDCSMPGLSVHHQLLSLLKLMPIESVMPSNHLMLCCPLLPPSIFPSIRVFVNESALRIRWTKCWSSSFSISPSNEYSRLISLESKRLSSLLQHPSSKASILRHSAFFMVQLSTSIHDHWKNHSLG